MGSTDRLDKHRRGNWSRVSNTKKIPLAQKVCVPKIAGDWEDAVGDYCVAASLYCSLLDMLSAIARVSINEPVTN